MDIQNGAIASKSVVPTAVDDSLNGEQAQGGGAHDARLTCHVQHASAAATMTLTSFSRTGRGGGVLTAPHTNTHVSHCYVIL